MACSPRYHPEGELCFTMAQWIQMKQLIAYLATQTLNHLYPPSFPLRCYLANWIEDQRCSLTLNVNKTKEMNVDFRKQQREHSPIHIDRTVMEKVEHFKFLGVHITDKLKWSTHTDSVVKKAQQRLFNLRRLKKFGLSLKTLTDFYRCTIESILSGCITAWYDKQPPQVIKTQSKFSTTVRYLLGGKVAPGKPVLIKAQIITEAQARNLRQLGTVPRSVM
ncbi:uncharacterized protein ACWYII_017740 [Salvelinus alpinus]